MIKGVVLNDLHFGIRDSKRLYHELSQFKNFILDDSNEIKVIIIAGDYFDCKLSLTDSASFYAFSFFKELLEICKEKSYKLRIIQGTKSHELNQLQLFEPFTEESGLDFKIIQIAQEEILFPKFHVLYLPEEYPENSQEYYKGFKTKKFNAIFGHGTWDFMAFQTQIDRGNETSIHSAPVFDFKEWESCIEKGFISFGHIHSRNVYKNKIFYSGAFSRWEFGDRSERGFTYFSYDTEKEDYLVQFIDNIEAPQYEVIKAEDILTESETTEDLIKILNEKSKEIDNLRIDISSLDSKQQEIVKETFKDNPKVKIISNSNNESMLKESEEVSKKLEKYSYITERKLPLEETIKIYANTELNVDLDLDTIKEILSSEESN